MNEIINKPGSVGSVAWLDGDDKLLACHNFITEKIGHCLKACDAGIADASQIAFACAFFPSGTGISVPQKLSEEVREILKRWRRQTPELSRRVAIALRSLPARTRKSVRAHGRCSDRVNCGTNRLPV